MLLVSALLAWALGWARTFVLAKVSERIGSNLRTTTYNHLLNLSVDYYGSKRTGDLMASYRRLKPIVSISFCR